MPVQTQLQMRRDTAANWTSTNPTLASGEWGLETNTRQYKIGDGATAWNSLGYQLGPLLDEEIATDPLGAYFTGSALQMFTQGSNLVSAPDSAALDITSDIDIRVKVSNPSWTTSRPFMAKYGAAGQRSWYFSLNNSGQLRLDWSADGTNILAAVSSVGVGLSANTTKWVRVTLDVNNGASGNDVIFYLSDDGTNWTQLGTTQTQAGVTSIFASTAPLEIGYRTGATTIQSVEGTFYRAQVLNGINGTTAFDANFETVPADSFAFTESSANAATVTLFTTRYSFGLPGATLTGTAAFSTVSNRTWYFPFTVRKPITLKHFAFESTSTPASNSTARIAIYNADAQLQPTGSKIIDSGAITVLSAAAAIYRVRVTPTILNPGNYLIAFNGSANAFNARFYRGNSFAVAPNTMGANLNDGFVLAEALAGGVFPTTGNKWTARTVANAAFANGVLLGWS